MTTLERQLTLPWASGPRIRETATDRETMRALEYLARGHDRCFAPASSLAAKLRISLRTAHHRVSRLFQLGLIERVWDSTLRSRRALVLLWRVSTTYVKSTVQGSCTSKCKGLAQETVPPSYCSELKEEKREIEQSKQAPPPASTVDVSPRDPEPEPAAEVAAKVRETLPDDPGAVRWAGRMARMYTPGWVVKALEVVAKRGQRGEVRNPRGLATKILQDYAIDGGPPIPLKPQPLKYTMTPELYARLEKIENDARSRTRNGA